jgi:hypothetical protein
MSFLNINDASWGEGNRNKMGFVVDNQIYNVDWISCVDGSNRGQHLFFFFRRVLVFQRRKRMNSVGRGPLGLNRFGMEKNRTEPNRN